VLAVQKYGSARESTDLTPRRLRADHSSGRDFGREVSGNMAERINVSLVCSECESRNYRTTRKKDTQGQLTLKKHCPKCKRHTVHKETK
jgi:large subunit ribosomal protein L33